MRKFKNKRNPILPLDIHIPDSEAHVMQDGKLYLYGSFDDQENEFCSEKYHVVSSGDLENWIIHDKAFSGKEVPWHNNPDAPKYPGIDWTKPTPFIRRLIEAAAAGGKNIKEESQYNEEGKKPALLFAPDCICKDGVYYLYFCMSDDSEGVAMSNCPEGPFTNPVQLPCGGIDPAIFIDDDGQAYYYWGQLSSHGVRMNENMITFQQKEVVDNLLTEEEHFFHEGSSMRKIGDTYYYVYADMERGKPTALGYATGTSPLGPFTYRGIIIDNANCDPASWNNHGSIECVDGEWYVFYHRCSRGSQQHRRLCIEPITINPDGTIDEVKMTSQGVGKPFSTGEPIMGYQACELKGGIYIGANKTSEDGDDELLTNISDGDEAVFRYVKSETGYSNAWILADGSGEIEVLLNGKAVGTIIIEEGKQKGSRIDMEAGKYELKLIFRTVYGLRVKQIVLE